MPSPYVPDDFVPKSWRSEIDPLGPPADPDTATDMGATAIADLESRVTDYSKGIVSATVSWAISGFLDTGTRLDQIVAPTADVSLNGHKATSAADATADTDLINRRSGDARYIRPASMETKFRLQDYGIVGDGVTVYDGASAPWTTLAADVASAGSSGARVVFPDGEFILDNCTLGPIPTAGHLVVEGQAGGTQLFPGPSGHGLKLSAAGGSRQLTARHLHLGWTPASPTPTDHTYYEAGGGPATPILEILNANKIRLVGITGYTNKQGVLLYLNCSYNGVMENCFLYSGDYGIGVLYDMAALGGSDQEDSLMFRDTLLLGSFPIAMNHLGAGSMMTFGFDNVKCVNSRGVQGSTHAESTLALAQVAGDSTLKVQAGDAVQFAVGDPIFVGRGSHADFEVAKITNVNTTTNVLTVDKPLHFGHDPAVTTHPIARGGVGIALPAFQLFSVRNSHLEGYLAGIYTGGGNGIDLNTVSFSCSRGIWAVGAWNGLTMRNVESQGAQFDSTHGGAWMNHLVDFPSWNTSMDASLSTMKIYGPVQTGGLGPDPVMFVGTYGEQPLTYYLAGPWSVEFDASAGPVVLPPGSYDFSLNGGGSGAGAGNVATGTTLQTGGGGGGAGAWIERRISLTASDSLTYTQGAGGNGGAAPGGNGSVGVDSTLAFAVLGITLTASGAKAGGSGASANSAAAVSGGLYGTAPGGAGTTPTAPGAGGTATSTTGGRGTSGMGRSGAGGGGGSHADVTGKGGSGGNAGNNGTGGAAVTTQTGTANGANGQDAPANGGDGGGGGGGAGAGGTAGAGGKGGSGRWILTKVST